MPLRTSIVLAACAVMIGLFVSIMAGATFPALCLAVLQGVLFALAISLESDASQRK